MKCEECGVTPQMGATLIRQNPKGEIGRWKCESHSAPPAQDLAQAIAEIQMGISDQDRAKYYLSGGLHPCYD